MSNLNTPVAAGGSKKSVSFLMWSPTDTSTALEDVTASTIVPFINVLSAPEGGQEPDSYDVSSLADRAAKMAQGREKGGIMPFPCNYTPDNYSKAKLAQNSENSYWFFLFMGEDSDDNPDGHYGAWAWKGTVHARRNELAQNGNFTMTVTCYTEDVAITEYNAFTALVPELNSVVLTNSRVGVESTLALVYASATPPTGPTLAYQWQLGESAYTSFSDIATGVTSTYTPVTADQGKFLRCLVSATGTARGTRYSQVLEVEAAA